MVDICLVTETYHPVIGGGETQAKVLANGFAAAGAAVTVITRRSDAAFAAHEALGGVGLWRVGPKGPGQLKKWGMLATVLVKLIQLRKNYDVIVVCGYRILGIPALWAARLLGKPCLLKADSLGELSGDFFRAGLARFGSGASNVFFRLFLRWRNRLLRRACRFIAISSAVEQELAEHGVSAERIVRIPNSVDTGRFAPVEPAARQALRRKLGMPPDAPVAIYTGRLVTPKGLPLLIAAWERVVHGHPDAHLLLVGSGGAAIQNCEAELRQLVVDTGLGGSVTFTGDVLAVHEYLQAADLFVFPTEREAFGISVIEAMACGLPVVTTAAGGLADIVSAERDAIVVPVGDRDALAAAIARVLNGGAEIRALGEAGRARAVAAYSEAQVLAEYAAVVEACAG